MLYRLLRGRFPYKIYLLASVIIILTICAHMFPRLKIYSIAPVAMSPNNLQTHSTRHLSKLITVVFRQFQDFENDIAESVESFVVAFPNMPVLILCQGVQYPPFQFSVSNDTLRNVKIIDLEFRLDASPQDLNPFTHILSEYVLIVPDSTRVSRRVMQQMVNAVTAFPSQAIAVRIGNYRVMCQQVKWNYPEWTLRYIKESPIKLCDAVYGQHALLIRTALLQILPQPFVLPFPESLYLQTTVRNIKIQFLESKFGGGRSVLKSPASKQKAGRNIRDTKMVLFKQIGIKAVVREDNKVQWFGCKKLTQRCYPSVQGTPSFILAGRHTPPCCRINIQRTVVHVLKTLLHAGVRCWLETTTLLGAVVRGDLLPWAEYAEIGVHASDITRVTLLQRGGMDQDGFVWERATKGHYYRVAYSATNRVYALILPFIAKNGTMKPADWVMAHQKEFPERHLHPLAQIQFAGRQAPAPNDARAFLDLKLGNSAVERCNRLGPKLLYP